MRRISVPPGWLALLWRFFSLGRGGIETEALFELPSRVLYIILSGVKMLSPMNADSVCPVPTELSILLAGRYDYYCDPIRSVWSSLESSICVLLLSKGSVVYIAFLSPDDSCWVWYIAITEDLRLLSRSLSLVSLWLPSPCLIKYFSVSASPF